MKVRGLLLFILCVLPLYGGEIKIFLKPSCELGDGVPTFADIARVSGSSEHIPDIRLVRVHSGDCSDGFIDRSEIRKLLLPFDDDITVYGNGVRLLPKDEKRGAAPVLIEKGSSVTIRIKRKRIVIETRGRAVNSASADDSVTVQLKNSKRVQGKVAGKNIVEVGL